MVIQEFFLNGTEYAVLFLASRPCSTEVRRRRMNASEVRKGRLPVPCSKKREMTIYRIAFLLYSLRYGKDI